MMIDYATALERVKALPEPLLREVLASLGDRPWREIAHAGQIPPDEWRTWYVRGGRGSGKTWTGANVLAEMAQAEPGEYGVVAPTGSACQDVCIEGPRSGLIHVLGTNPSEIKRGASRLVESYNITDSIVRLRNGSIIYGDGADDGAPTIQGKNLRGLWADEVGLWRKWDLAWNESIRYAVRLAPARIVATGTPKAGHPLVKALMADATVHKTLLRTADNIANLDADFIAELYAKYGGTQRGRQELEGEIIDDVAGALWHRPYFRYGEAPDLVRVVVGIDPAVTSEETSDLTGIVAAGKAADRRGWVLADRSGRYTPDGWARAAVDLAAELGADAIIVETNNGGDMCKLVLENELERRRQAGESVAIAVRGITASRGKRTRAEPISQLYEQGRVSHAEPLPDLEDQLCLAAGSRIATIRGLVPIEEVVTGDLVLTRKGWRPVLWSGLTGYRPVITIQMTEARLRCTAGHPVYAEGRGFVPAREVHTGVIIRSWLTPYGASSWNTTASDTSARTTATTGRAVLGDDGSFIAMCGRRLTALCRRVERYITSTTIAATTPWLTLRPSPVASTFSSTGGEVHGQRRMMFALLGVKPNGAAVSLDRIGASGVTGSSSRPANEQGSAPGHVVDVSAETNEPEPVYNLTVADAHEFYAEGLLVHNCTWEPESDAKSPDRLDAMVWALTDLMLGEPGILGMYRSMMAPIAGVQSAEIVPPRESSVPIGLRCQTVVHVDDGAVRCASYLGHPGEDRKSVV